jgi:flagellar protein FliS
LAYNDALTTYKETRIVTASQGQLILMLYGEAVRQMDRALILLEKGETGKKDPSMIEKVGKSVVKTQEIISELMVSLDFEQGGDIAKNLFSLYSWFNHELMEANISQDARRISIVRNHLDDLRSAWQEVAITTATETVNREVVGLDIAM